MAGSLFVYYFCDIAGQPRCPSISCVYQYKRIGRLSCWSKDFFRRSSILALYASCYRLRACHESIYRDLWRQYHWRRKNISQPGRRRNNTSWLDWLSGRRSRFMNANYQNSYYLAIVSNLSFGMYCNWEENTSEMELLAVWSVRWYSCRYQPSWQKYIVNKFINNSAKRCSNKNMIKHYRTIVC